MWTLWYFALATYAGEPGIVVKIVLLSVVGLPLASTYGAISAATLSPILIVPLPLLSLNSIGTSSTPLTSPTSLAMSARGPPSFPVQASRIAFFWAALALLLMYTTAFQFPLSTLPGIWATSANAIPLTSTPSMVPLSIRYARNASQAPPSGSSPTQHGHGELQEHASRSEPWTRYFALVAIDGPPSFDRCARITAAAYVVARGRGGDPEARARRRRVGHGPGTDAWKHCAPVGTARL